MSRGVGEQRPPTPVLVFDIETVPDIPLFLDCDESFIPNKELPLYWNDWPTFLTVSATKNSSFPPPLFHVVVSICAVFLDPETHRIIDGVKLSVQNPLHYADLAAQEQRLLKQFWEFSLKYQDRHKLWYDALQSDRRLSDYLMKKLRPLPVTFCGFNIIGFDLPVIEQRSFKNGVTCPLADYALELGTESYRYRYAADKCFDLMQYLSNFGASKNAGLQAYARSIGLAGKLEGMSGAHVGEEFFLNHAYAKIEEYCSVDVLITYGVYLQVQLFRGVLSPSHYRECVSAFQRFLRQEGKPQSYKKLAEASVGFFAAATRDQEPFLGD